LDRATFRPRSPTHYADAGYQYSSDSEDEGDVDRHGVNKNRHIHDQNDIESVPQNYPSAKVERRHTNRVHQTTRHETTGPRRARHHSTRAIRDVSPQTYLEDSDDQGLRRSTRLKREARMVSLREPQTFACDRQNRNELRRRSSVQSDHYRSNPRGELNTERNFEAPRRQHYSPNPSRSSDEYRNKPKQRDPKAFDGNKIEWSDYLKHFEAVSTWNKWTSDQKAQQLVMSFDGEALKLLGEFSPEILNDYDKLVEELNRRYNPAERAQAWKIEFRNRTRKPNESIMQYAQALKRLVCKAFPNMSNEAQEQWVVDQFNLGLGSTELRRHVQFGHPSDVNEAISLAIEFEAFEAGNKEKKKPLNPHAEVFTMSGSPTLKTENDQGHSKGNYPKSSPRVERDPNQETNRKPWDMSKIECHYCKKMGHMIRDCRKLKAKHEQEELKEKNSTKPSNPPSGN
jgi:hypothetical protein